MRAFSVSSIFLVFLCSLVFPRGISEQARSPPRGWNSYDSFCWTISEQEFLQNAQIVAQRLHVHGYEYVVVDYLWYRRKVKGAYVDSLGFDVIDEWGRMVPDPGRWPSSRGGKGFAEVARKVHSMGLKFGIHVMRGISTQAFNANTPILDISTGKAYEEAGRKWYAKDIGIKERACAWMKNGFMSVNTKLGAGRAFLRSLYQQYADWGVDFVKHDCVFGEDLELDEITYVSKVLTELKHPITYSLSPGSSATPAMAKEVSGLVNMYRITGDDWDTWPDVAAHFDVTWKFSAANLIGAKGLNGKSWPDSDMLPFGWLTDPGSNDGPHRKSKLTPDEQRSQMTLWSMAKSPLMFGGDMRQLDDATFSLITNPTLLEINAFSSNNREFPYISNRKCRRVRNRASTCQRRNKDRLNITDANILRLTTCKESKAKGWSARSIENDVVQVCWKGNKENGTHLCLYKRRPSVLLGDGTYKHHFDGKVQLLGKDMTNLCLSASPNQKLTSKRSERGSFSPCTRHANQMWELNHNGTLKNSYSGLCASMRTIKAKSGSNAHRIWVATGRGGEIYVAFFNLDGKKAEMSMRIADVAKALPGKKIVTSSCKCREEWSGKDFEAVKESVITRQLEIHGCALFTLKCTTS